jgi:ribosome biogenesis GTPase
MPDNHHFEEEDYFSDRKLYRMERKLASRLDRSKYKKTDQKKKKVEEPIEAQAGQKSGLVLCVKPQEIVVSSDGTLFTCSIRGVLKKEKTQHKNLVVVGDRVVFEDLGKNFGMIVQVKERKTALSRAEHLEQQKEQLIAANVDQVFITVSVVDPLLRVPIIDRYVIAAIKGNISPIIVCNKIDLLQRDDPSVDEQKAILEECLRIYPKMGIPFLPVSCETRENIDMLIHYMKDKISVFSGQSGTGKSSLINATAGFSLKVGETVQSSKKGAHTTSFAQLLELPFGGCIVDTPGIKSFGIWNIQKEELRPFFVDIAEAGLRCRFLDCYHRGEAGCAIVDAIEKGEVSPLRYESYLNILSSIEEEHFRR